jgi:hypothetical protein
VGIRPAPLTFGERDGRPQPPSGRRGEAVKKAKVEIVKDRSTGLLAVVINGVRITPEKHTGSWTTVKKWNVDRQWIVEALRAQE